MNSSKKIARIAGFLYLIVVITGFFSLAYVPKLLFNWNDPSATYKNIVTNETLFRFSILSSVVCYVAFIALPLFLYELLKSVQPIYAKFMVTFALLSVPISIINLLNKLSILHLINEHNSIDVELEKQKQVMSFLNQYDNGILLAMVFWGLWLFPFGYLVFKSGFIPKILGILLMLGCFGYLVNFTGNLLIKDYSNLGIASKIGLLPTIGELSICVWLLLIGVRENKTNDA